MSTTHEPDVNETEVIDRPVVEQRVERVERVREPGYIAPARQVNVNANPYAPVWTVTRVITLLFTVLEVLLLLRFIFKIAGARTMNTSTRELRANFDTFVSPSCTSRYSVIVNASLRPE